MGTMTTVFVFLGGILATTISRVVADDAKEWNAWLIERLICRAVEKLPSQHRERKNEEWRAHVLETPGQIAKLFVAADLSRAARTMRKPTRQAVAILARRFLTNAMWLAFDLDHFSARKMISASLRQKRVQLRIYRTMNRIAGNLFIGIVDRRMRLFDSIKSDQ